MNDCTCFFPNPFPEYEQYAKCVSGRWIIETNVEKSNPQVDTPTVIQGNATLTGVTHFRLPGKLYLAVLIIQQIQMMIHGLLWKDA